MIEACVKCGSTKALEVHHLSYDPPETILLCRKHHQEIHGITVIEGALTEVMRRYGMYVKLITKLKNWSASWERQFNTDADPVITKMVDNLELRKKDMMKEAKYELGSRLKLQERWKGIGPRHLAYLFGFADPKRFSSVGRFLYYNGYKGAAKENKNYNHKMCAIGYTIAESLIRARNDTYYPIYLKIKEGFGDERKIVAHRKAMNRITTLWLKEFYKVARENFI